MTKQEAKEKEGNRPPVKIAIELTDKKISVGILGGSSQKDIKSLEDLVESAKRVGKTIDIKKTSIENGRSYLITFTINPNKAGVTLIDILKYKIDRLEDARGVYETAIKQIQLAGIPTDYDRYLGNWLCANPALKIRVGKDLEKLYEIFKRELEVSVEDVYSRKKPTNTSFARAVIILILSQKYSKKELGLLNISKIIKKEYITVVSTVRKFHDLKLEAGDYEDLNSAFKKCLGAYSGRKPYFGHN